MKKNVGLLNILEIIGSAAATPHPCRSQFRHLRLALMTDTFVFHTVAGLQYSLPRIQLATADNIDMDDCSGMSSRGWHHLAPLGAVNSGRLNLPIRPYADRRLPFDRV